MNRKPAAYYRISSPDHSAGGVWDAAKKQVAGEEIREAPHFSQRGYGHFPAQYCEAMGGRHPHTYTTKDVTKGN